VNASTKKAVRLLAPAGHAAAEHADLGAELLGGVVGASTMPVTIGEPAICRW
jgi:hypothetical protein